MKKLLCTICARSGSKGIKNKNLLKINGKPLFYYTLMQAKTNKLIDNIVLSTDSKKISKEFEKFGLSSFFIRSKNLSSSKAGKVPVIRDALLKAEDYYKQRYDYIIDLDITSPLRLNKDINSAFKKFLNNNADILFSVCEAKKNPYFNMIGLDKNKIKLIKKNSKF
jgi:CMP-N-acetylneuraminic acid synthetase